MLEKSKQELKVMFTSRRQNHFTDMSKIIISRSETCWGVYRNKEKYPLIHKITFYYVLYCTPLLLFWLSLGLRRLVRTYGKALFLQV